MQRRLSRPLFIFLFIYLIIAKHTVICHGATELWALHVTSSRLEHRLCVLLLPWLDSLPSPKVEVVGDNQGPGGGSEHGAEDGLGHFAL